MAAREKISPLSLIVLVLGFSHLIISMNAVPITRTRGLMHGTNAPRDVSMNTQFENVQKRWEVGAIKRRILNVELNDYPGSGANNRHTPKPQVGRVCVDC